MCSFGLSLWSNEFKFIYDWIWFYLTKNGNNIETPRRSQRAVIVIAPGVLINWCGCWAGSTASWMLANTVVRQRNIYLKPDFRIGLTTKNYTKIKKKQNRRAKNLHTKTRTSWRSFHITRSSVYGVRRGMPMRKCFIVFWSRFKCLWNQLVFSFAFDLMQWAICCRNFLSVWISICVQTLHIALEVAACVINKLQN